MTYEQFNRALNFANAIRLVAKEKLKEAGWQEQEFEIALHFEVDLNDSEEVAEHSEFIYACSLNGITKYTSYKIKNFLTDTFPLEIFKLGNSTKDYFIETSYVEKE